ncbi:HAD family phosphatase [bacterium]|nr:HAD family phosphatase [bacterium]
MIEILIFDLGGVFLHLHIQRIQQRLDRWLSHIEPKDRQQKYDTLKPIQTAYESGHIGTFGFIQQLERHFEIEINALLFKNIWQDMFTVNHSMVNVLSDLSNRYPCHLLSNTNALHMTYLYQKYDFFKYFKAQTLSYEVGLLKPDIKIYKLAAKAADTEIDACLFIDDNANNVEAARSIGMQAIHYTDMKSFLNEMIRDYAIDLQL